MYSSHSSVSSRTWSDSNKNFRIAVIGAAMVGKTAIVNQFLYTQFPGKYSKTNTDIHYKKFEGIDVDILDSGYLEYPDLRKVAIKNVNAFILVFSLDDMASFNFMVEVRNEIVELKGGSTPYIVVGNKADIVDGRCVPFALADCLVSIEWERIYCEVSAKHSNDLSNVFSSLFRLPSTQRKIREIRCLELCTSSKNGESSKVLEELLLFEEEKAEKRRGKFRKYICL